MKQKILIIYKSSTGFTKKYAVLLAKRLNCTVVDLKHTKSVSLSDFDTIIFGTRAHAESIDGLKKFRKTLHQYGRAGLDILFVTGAASASEKEAIDRLWKNNLTADELAHLPHFYLPAGLCYEKMSFTDKMMMKGLAAMLKSKKDKTEKDIELEQRILNSFDISSEKYIEPIITYISQDR